MSLRSRWRLVSLLWSWEVGLQCVPGREKIYKKLVCLFFTAKSVFRKVKKAYFLETLKLKLLLIRLPQKLEGAEKDTWLKELNFWVCFPLL